jgi:predicted TIM-barrel fold metal-dependent hydrolase
MEVGDMSNLYHLKIDIFSHIMPPKYKDALFKILPADSCWRKNVESRPTLFDIERRLGIMDRFDGMVQVLTSSAPAVELLAEPKKAVELAKMANDEMAELVSRYPDRFIAAVAAVPINDVDASLKEIERAINDLEFRGIQINTPVDEKPLDSSEFIRADGYR